MVSSGHRNKPNHSKKERPKMNATNENVVEAVVVTGTPMVVTVADNEADVNLLAVKGKGKSPVGNGGNGSMEAVADARGTLYRIDPRKLVVLDGWNAREDGERLKGHIEALATSIAEKGVLEPLTAYMLNGSPVISNGHCRYFATMLVIERGGDVKTVPVIVEPRGSNDADRLASQFIRNSGLPLTALEKAAIAVRLSGFGWTNTQIAAVAGLKSEVQVNHLFDIAELPEAVKSLIRANKIATTEARLIWTENDRNPEVVMDLIQRALDEAGAAGKERVTARFVSQAVVKATEEATGETAVAEVTEKAPRGERKVSPLASVKKLFASVYTDEVVMQVDSKNVPIVADGDTEFKEDGKRVTLVRLLLTTEDYDRVRALLNF